MLHNGGMTEPLRAPMPGAENLTDALRDRWSTAAFDVSHTLTHQQLDLLLRAAQWAPSGSNVQPWSFIVLARGTAGHQTLVDGLSRGNSGWVPRASAVILTAAQVGEDEEGNGPKWPHLAYHDLGVATAQLIVKAHAMGLSTHPFAGFDSKGVGKALGVPEWYQVIAGGAVGVHGDRSEVSPEDQERDLKERTRKPLSEIAYDDKWGNPWVE